MLDQSNVLVKSFRMVRDKMHEEDISAVRLKLIGRRDHNVRTYNMPSTNEVATLIVGDFDSAISERDILVETQSGALKQINEPDASYLALQYPLLLPYGEDSYKEDIPLIDSKSIMSARRKKLV